MSKSRECILLQRKVTGPGEAVTEGNRVQGVPWIRLTSKILWKSLTSKTVLFVRRVSSPVSGIGLKMYSLLQKCRDTVTIS
jgi:hypothetical protein